MNTKSISARQRGITMVETLVTMSLVAILASLAVPSFKEATLSSELRGNANDLVTGINLAKSEAYKRNEVVRVCASFDLVTCAGGTSWKYGWIVRTNAAVLMRHGAAADGFRLSGSVPAATLAFDPNGTVPQPGWIFVCRHDPEPGAQARFLQIDASGRVRVMRLNTNFCF